MPTATRSRAAKQKRFQSITKTLAGSPFAFVLVMGIVNLFGDVTYEGGASINGSFLGSLGASAAAVSIIAGLGEFLGYSLRSVFGWLADKTGRYWLITGIGYAINLLAVPAMALAGNWQTAGALILAERIGRSMRKPTVEAMLSYSAERLGRGWVYALNTALDETGATLGPLIIAFALYRRMGYRGAYSVLLISVALALVAVLTARIIFPVPSRLASNERDTQSVGFTTTFWLYMIGAACFGAGLMSFEFISLHFSIRHVVSDQWIPVFLSVSTAGGIFASLMLGKFYDRFGLPVVLIAVSIAAMFSPLVFLGGAAVALSGLILWGIGYAVQDTLLKAVVAGMLPKDKRNFAFGIFYAGYGGGWLIGSITTGFLYAHSVTGIIVFSMAIQLAAIPLFVLAERHRVSG